MTQATTPVNNASANLAPLHDNLSLEAVIGHVLRSWKLLTLCIVIALAIGYFLAWQAPTVWQADALVQVEDAGASQPLQEFADFVGKDEGDATTEIEVLRSRNVLGKTVDSLSLTISATPAYFPHIGEPIARRWGVDGEFQQPKIWLPKPLRFHQVLETGRFAWGGEKIKVDRLEVAENLINVGFVVINKGAGNYRVTTADDQLVGTGMVGGGFEQVPEWQGGEVSLFISELQSRVGSMFYVRKKTWSSAVRSLQQRVRLAEKGRGTGLIVASMNGSNPREIERTLSSILNNYVTQNVERRSEQAKRSLDFLEKQLPSTRVQVQAAEDALNDYKQQKSAIDLPSETQSILSGVIAAEEELKQIQLKREELSQVYGNAHPSMKSLSERAQSARNTLAKLQSQVDVLPETQQEVLRLSRDLEVATSLYTFLLNKTQELRVFKAGTVGNVRVLDAALALDYPVGPKRGRMLFIAAIIGLLAGLAIIALRQLTSRRIGDSREVEKLTGLSVYCVVPRSSQQFSFDRSRAKRRGQMPLAAEHPQDIAIEALRSLRTSLHFALMDSDSKNGNCVAFTSPSPGAGKSFVSLNLAWVMAESGKRVVIIDADMRRGELHKRTSQHSNPGLSEVLSGQNSFEESVLNVEGNFFLLPAGTKPPNPSELLMSDKFSHLLEKLSGEFDLVVIDTPPILAVTDAGIIAPQIAASFMVARAGLTHRGELESAIDRIGRQGVKVTGVVLNDLTKSSTAYGYDSYSYYSYE